MGQFVAIDITSKEAFLGATPEEAFEAAKTGAPQGTFHLIKVGSRGAYRVTYASRASLDWIFQ